MTVDGVTFVDGRIVLECQRPQISQGVVELAVDLDPISRRQRIGFGHRFGQRYLSGSTDFTDYTDILRTDRLFGVSLRQDA